MYERLFAKRGLSLDRLRVLLEVRETGSMVRAASGDPVVLRCRPMREMLGNAKTIRELLTLPGRVEEGLTAENAKNAEIGKASRAPKGRHIPAQGNALGIERRKWN